MDNKKLMLAMTVLKIVLVAIGVIACVLVISGPNAEAELADREAFLDGGSLGLAMNYTVYIIAAGVIVVLLFFLVQLITNTKRTFMSIVGVIGAALVYLIFLGMGTTDTNESLKLAEDVMVEDSTIASTTAGILTVLTALGVAALSWILSPVMGRFRK